jgi:hypothetical protein
LSCWLNQGVSKDMLNHEEICCSRIDVGLGGWVKCEHKADATEVD